MFLREVYCLDFYKDMPEYPTALLWGRMAQKCIIEISVAVAMNSV